jgi:hypothetical protein
VKTFIAFSAAVMAIGLLASGGESLASGLKIEPGGLLVQEVPVGEARSLVESSGMKFVVYNHDDIPRLYRVSAHRPSDTGNGKWPRGYSEIPDASWIVPTPDVLEIPADSSASFDVLIQLPDDARLYNQKWAVTLEVESDHVNGKNVALALYPIVQIETRANALSDSRPLGAVAVAPATLRANGRGEPLSFAVYNNDSEPHDYLVHVEPAAGKIPPSPGMSSANSRGLVIPKPERFRIEPGGAAQVLLEVDPGADETEGPQPWEQLIFVESESGQCTFVRLQGATD